MEAEDNGCDPAVGQVDLGAARGDKQRMADGDVVRRQGSALHLGRRSDGFHQRITQLIALRRQNESAEAAAPIMTGVDISRLRFRYAIEGDNPPWRPVSAFDDGSKVYIEMPAGIAQGEAPPLFVVGPEGDGQLVNYRVRQNYYIVDRLFAAAELRMGGEHQQTVRISRTDGRTR